MQQANKTVKCPACGKPGKLEPGAPGKLVLNCICNPIGPTLETDDPKVKHENKTEVKI